MKAYQFFQRSCALVLTLLVAGVASAQQSQTDSQGFKVIVPANISITAPDAVELTHDQSDNNQTFPAQSWIVKGNLLNGVNVSFATASPFVHTSGNFKRDAGLALALGTTQGPATWTITTPTDATNYGNSVDSASVAASSNGVGRADLDLTVTFVTEQFGIFAAGDYNLTVVGTVAGN
ncbi:MAG: hypothetical protein KDB03_20765 [Planctomycetales bacterium]|nr:hypothetical protein [Planctomycetales bacterium]